MMGSTKRPGSVFIPQCQRCKRFILSKTSTAKRMHNVKCLSTSITKSSCDILQEFLNVGLPDVSVKLLKVSHEDLLRENEGKLDGGAVEHGPPRLEKFTVSQDFESCLNQSDMEMPVLAAATCSGTTPSIGKKRGRPPKLTISERSDSPTTENKCSETLCRSSQNKDKAVIEKNQEAALKRKPGRPRKQSTKDVSEGKDYQYVTGIHDRVKRRAVLSGDPRETVAANREEIVLLNKRPGRPRRQVFGESVSKDLIVTKKRMGRPLKNRGRLGRSILRSVTELEIINATNPMKKRGRPPKKTMHETPEYSNLGSKLVVSGTGQEKPLEHLIKMPGRPFKRRLEDLEKSPSPVRINIVNICNNSSNRRTKSVVTKLLKNARKRPPGSGRKMGSKTDDGVDASNIIEGSSRQRNSLLKAQEKLKSLVDDDNMSDEDVAKRPVRRYTPRRWKRNDDSDFDIDCEDTVPDSDQETSKVLKTTRGRSKYLEPLSQREKYLIFSKGLSYDFIRATEGKVGARRYRKDKPVKQMTKKEKYQRYIKREMCTICQELVRSFYMKDHMNHFHNESHDQNDCECDLDHCGSIPESSELALRALRRSSLTKKIKDMTPQEVYARYVRKGFCTFCKKTVREFYMKEHVMHFHTEGHDQRNCKCDMSHCNPVAGNPTKARHREKPDGIAPGTRVECQMCYKMIRKSSMKRHLRLHDRLKNKLIRGAVLKLHKCVVCDKKFALQSTIKVHFIQKHLASNPFICRYPGCVFKGGEFYRLERHVQTHMSRIKLECKTCKQKFVKLETLVRHRTESKSCHPVKDESPPMRVKTETIVNVGSVQIQDKILETEDGALHVKGERLDEVPDLDEDQIHINKLPNADIKPEKGDELSDGEGADCDQGKLREKVYAKILSWNDKLQDTSYINNLIREDPLFQKLQVEHEEFARQLVKGERSSYFLPHRTSAMFSHRCKRCGSAFRRGWALQKHIQQSSCELIEDDSQKKEEDANENQSKGNASAHGNGIQAGEKMTSKGPVSFLDFMCNTCGFKTKSALELEYHMKNARNHHDLSKSFPCPKKCGSTYDDVKKLHAHLDTVHFKPKTFKCSQCPRLFTTDNLRKNHFYNLHVRSVFRCIKCGNTYSKENRQKHEKECKKTISKPKCMQCNEFFCNSTSLRRHVTRVHKEGFSHPDRDYNLVTDEMNSMEDDINWNEDEPVLVTTPTVENNEEALIIGF